MTPNGRYLYVVLERARSRGDAASVTPRVYEFDVRAARFTAEMARTRPSSTPTASTGHFVADAQAARPPPPAA